MRFATRLLLLVIVISYASLMQASIIASEGFNNSVTVFSMSGGTYFTGNSGSGDRPASSSFSSEGTHAIGVSNGTLTLTSNTIDTSAYSDLVLSFRLASFSINSTGNGADVGDYIRVEISPDGSTYYNTLEVLGNNNAYWHYSTGTGLATTAYDGNTTTVSIQPSSGGNRTTDGYSSVTVTGLPSISTLKVRITALNNSSNERWVIDDFKLESLTPPPNAPVAITADNISTNSFTAKWNSVSNATGYRLDVYTKSGSNASDLFISEYVEGSSNNKFIEIYNGTGVSKDLSNYSLKHYNNGSTSPTYTLNLSGTLSNNSVYVIANNSATIYTTANLKTTSNVMTFNGNDAIALFNSTTLVDVVGTIGDSNNWGLDVTFVRKISASVPSATYSSADWTSYGIDTATYLGSHTYNGLVITPVTGYPDKDVTNVTSYVVNGLTANTQYYYVVRAYNASGTSGNSNEISVQTINYDYPNGNPVTSDGVTVTFNTGDGNNSSTGTSTAPNPNFTATFKKVITLVGSGPWNITLSAPVGSVPWFAYRRGTTWTSYANTTGSVTIDIPAKKDVEIEIQGGSGQDPTLPVELSSFMATLTAQNTVSVMWVTQSETNVNGYYVYRGMSSDLQEASTVSPLIPATNTSQQQMYQYTDSEVFEPGTYYYWLQVQDLDGSIQFHGPTTVYFDNGNNPGTPVIPKVTELKSVYPNPFNPSTTISYSLAKAETVDFVIFNSRGQIVRSFNEGNKGIGNHSFNWFGDDQNGKPCSTGVYFIKMNAGKDSFIRKAVLMK